VKWGTNSANFVKIAQGIRPCGRSYSTFLSNLSKNFSFWGPTPLSLHQWGWNAKFHPIGATCRPCGAKRLKISLWIN